MEVTKMELEAISTLVSTLGFPIATAIVLAYFMYKMIHLNNERTQEMLNMIQDSNKGREERLLNELAECRSINETAIMTIASYSEKLGEIQRDVGDIKTNITKMSANF
jgi:hypothetical protein